MITLPQKTYNIDGGVAPYSYTFTSDNNCISFDTVSGTSTTGNISVVISALNETCLQTATVTLSVVDAEGCPSSLEVDITDVCTNLTVSAISQTDTYTFAVSASSPQCNSISYVWTYDTTLFTTSGIIVNSSGTTIQLQPIDGVVFPATAAISVTATDCNGCTETSSFTYTVCRPLPESFVYYLYCNDSETQYVGSEITLQDPVGCSSYEYDWSTVQYGPIASGLTVIPNGQLFSVVGDISLTPGTYSVDYSVSNTDGIQSLEGTITIIVNSCAPGNTIFIPSISYTIDCGVLAGDVIEIPITYSTSDPSVEIDWSTWTLIDPPTPAAVTAYGAGAIVHATQADGTHVIQYQVPATTGTDVFIWSVCDTLGNCATSSTYTIILDCGEGPIANADTACASCGESVVIDVLTNDDPNGDLISPSTIIIVSAPTSGVANPLNDGTIVYTPTISTGSDSFTYKVANVSGYFSNAALVSVDIICAGEDNEIDVCNT